MAVYGEPTWLDALLGQVEAQISKGANLPRDRVFLSLADDADHLAFPPADTFAVARPLSFPVNAPGVSGGGRLLTGFDGRLRVALFNRYAADQEFRDSRRLRDRTLGILAQFLKLLDALQLFEPAGQAGNVLLREPMRVESFDLTPHRSKDGGWAVLPSVWSMKFTADIPA